MTEERLDTGVDNVREANALRVRGDAMWVEVRERLAVESPLAIQVRTGGRVHEVSTTMRTPGDDAALAVGFLFAEGILPGDAPVRAVELRDQADDGPDGARGSAAAVAKTIAGKAAVARVVIDDAFAPRVAAALATARRSVLTSAACGACGRPELGAAVAATIAAAAQSAGPGDLRVAAATIHALPGRLREAQAAFAETGGLHAAGVFTADGGRGRVFEDVGRHNAVDKLVGALLLDGALPARDSVLVVSGRASYELVQKASAAGFGVMVAVGAPSTLAVELAVAADLTLVGFARARGFNVYAGRRRVAGLDTSGVAAPRAEAHVGG